MRKGQPGDRPSMGEPAKPAFGPARWLVSKWDSPSEHFWWWEVWDWMCLVCTAVNIPEFGGVWA